MLALRFLKDFFEKNLFERIIVYLVLSAFITKFVFEFVLGQWYFEQSQNQQWLFYSFLLLDYVVSFRKVTNIRVTVNRNAIFAFLLLIMMAQGILVGLSLHNHPFVMFNDMVPLLMIALNILRMQSLGEMARPIDFAYIFKSTITLTFLTCIIGFAATLLGKPANAAIEIDQIFFPALMAPLFIKEKYSKIFFVFAAVCIALSLEDINRTTMLFLFFTSCVYLYKIFLTKPVKGLFIVLLTLLALTLAFFAVPKDSNTYRRISDIASIDLESRKGSVGERQAERDAIQSKLDSLGSTYQMLGLGLGGLYEVAFTHRYITDYGHAHYAWAWFNLRFGMTGYIYLAIMISILAMNFKDHLRSRTELGIFQALIIFSGLLYCLTYVNGVFVLSGLHFLNPPQRKAS